MTRTVQKKLIEKIVPELSTYLRKGKINPDLIEKNINYDGIEKIQDVETIFKIRFVLTEKVVNFLKELPNRVRRIKTECEKRTLTRKGEVRGKIDWKKTTTKQLTDKTIFVCRNPSKNYDVPENLVLKKILSVIYQVLDDELTTAIEKDYEWLGELRGEEDLVNSLKNIYDRNVHVNRIKDPKEYQVSERDISRAQNSRKQLYKEAADLLIKYRGLMRGNYEEDDLRKLFKETLIIPRNDSTLFELYSVFQLIKRWNENEKNFELKKIDEDYDEIAIYEKGNTKKRVYHNDTGNITFYESLDDLEKEIIQYDDQNVLARLAKSFIKNKRLKDNLLDIETQSFYQGVPDIVVKKNKNNSLEELIIGEVKYSKKERTFIEGLEQLVTYLHFAKTNDSYLLEKSDLKGILVVDEKNLDEDKLDEENKVIDNPLPCELYIYDTEDLAEVL